MKYKAEYTMEASGLDEAASKVYASIYLADIDASAVRLFELDENGAIVEDHPAIKRLLKERYNNGN